MLSMGILPFHKKMYCFGCFVLSCVDQSVVNGKQHDLSPFWLDPNHSPHYIVNINTLNTYYHEMTIEIQQ